MPELILHVGIPKTATTTIQRTLNEQREHLLAQGALYPVSCRFPASAPSALTIQHHSLAAGLHSEGGPDVEPGMIPLKPFVVQVSELKTEIEKEQPSRVILSSEIFWSTARFNEIALAPLVRAFEGYTCKILVGLRRIPSLVPSLYATLVQSSGYRLWEGSYSGSLQRCLDEYLLPAGILAYRERLDMLEHVFGPDSVYPYWFEETQADVLAPLADLAGIHLLENPGKHENIRKSWLQVALRRRSNGFSRLLHGYLLPAGRFRGTAGQELDRRFKKASGRWARRISRLTAGYAESWSDPVRPGIIAQLERLQEEQEKLLAHASYGFFPWRPHATN